MKYRIDPEAHIPAYLQLYRQLRADIVRGIFPFGSRLPSKRTLALEAGVSTVTAEHALALLSDEGYIESRPRSGSFVIFRTGDGFAAASEAHLMPPRPNPAAEEFPFSVLTRTMRAVMSDYGEAILNRSPGSGCQELREAIRAYLARSRGILADTEQIIIGSGAEYLYSLIVELLGRDRIYALESPSYQKIEQVYRAADVRCEMLPLGTDGIESSALRASRAEVLHISPYRSFPSGVTASASKRIPMVNSHMLSLISCILP
ncbi:MAG: GntR family transcriptional regulator [Oscillospiraceae bacterium]|nr:GntR family transcriptional regulator [Oscillospiraceae bacterium]